MKNQLPDVIEKGRRAGERNNLNGVFEVIHSETGRTLYIVCGCPKDEADWTAPQKRPSERHVSVLPLEKRAIHNDIWGDKQEISLPLPSWEHVSVSCKYGVPTWVEMCWVKDQFWNDDEWVIQFHPAHNHYVNIHENVLHLWKPIGVEIPYPPRICV